MKKNDIFEQEFEGQTIRFQLIELKPYLVAVKTIDVIPPAIRGGNLLLAALPKVALAKYVDGEYVTTAAGDKWVKRFSVDIYNRIAARGNSLKWLVERKGMDQNEAKALVEKLDTKFNHWEIRYLPVIARWAYNGEIDPESETDINRAKNILLTYFTYLGDRKNDGSIRIKYLGHCFKRMIEGQLGAYLRTMDEVEDVLWPWTKKIIHFNRMGGDHETKTRKNGE